MTLARPLMLFLAAAGLVALPVVHAVVAQDSVPTGVREAAWSPDGRRLAVTWFDALWTMTPDGRDRARLVRRAGEWTSERDPAWSPDGRSIAFAADTRGAFDIWVVPAGGGEARQVTDAAGDERWPSWTADGRLVYSHRPPAGDWALYAVGVGGGAPTRLSPEGAVEWHGRVSPDGRRVAFVSTTDRAPGDDADLFVRSIDGSNTTRVTTGGGQESYPVWAPDNLRLAYAASRGGASGVWVSAVSPVAPAVGGGRGRGGRGAGRGAADSAVDTVLASRRTGVPAWSPDGAWLAIATAPPADGAGYNGNPDRSDADAPVAFADAEHFALWRIAAPRPIDADAAAITLGDPDSSRWTRAFDQVWQTLASMYYRDGAGAEAWAAARARHRPDMARVSDAAGAEAVIDRLVADQPLIKPALESSRGVVASGHPLASAAGADVLARGGNVVDAGIATAFALGVVEPDASGLGGDGQAILYLRGMAEPVVIEYKDMTPSRATRDNPRIFRPDGSRTAADGPTVANIPGVVAGLDLLYQKYGSRQVSWADLVAPAIDLAENGYVLDEALPTTIAVGRERLLKYPEAARIFLPGGRVPKAGERFVNRDYAATLRTIAAEGGDAFYRGSIAQQIAADMEASGGIITVEDLAQYRAMERTPIMGEFRGHRVYTPGAPVPTGVQLLESLQILDHQPARPGTTYATDADTLHYAIEAWRVRDGGARMADPERWPTDLGNHLERDHARERFGLIAPDRVYTAQGGRGRGAPPPAPATDDDIAGRRIETGTTAFVVADAEGNMIAFTQTLSTWGGTFYVSKGLGFLYNDHFRGGRGGTGYGSTLPLMRSSTTSVPTLVFAPARVEGVTGGMPGFTPRLAVGAAGNAWIPASVYNVILNVIDGGLSAQRAIEAPRMLIGSAPGGGSRVQIEDRISRDVRVALESRGHTFAMVGRKGEVKYGYAAVAVVNTAKGTVEGGAEPRRSHGTAAPAGSEVRGAQNPERRR
ncbi:MAG TPA: gamma-glutamyltransferase [Vicinamibacterales bacterium]|nr:gamma-glutamyltransferase [Vicinamibacterales bacterium]